MVADAITGNISGEATTLSGNIFAEAMRFRCQQTRFPIHARWTIWRDEISPIMNVQRQLLKINDASLVAVE